MTPDLTVSLISADNLNYLLPCLKSIYENTHRASVEVFVVDNASSDGTADIVKSLFPQVHTIINTKRLGFSTNNDLVISKGIGRYVMLLNDDTLVKDCALDRLIEFMDAHTEVGAVGGYLLNPDNSDQSSYAAFPHPFVEGFFPVASWYSRIRKRPTEPINVDSICGAAMVVRREVIETVGVLDTAFDPIYSEEVDWCFRIRRAGWKIYTVPSAQVVHYGSQTMNKAVPQKYELLLAHKALFFRKHWGNGWAFVYKISLSITSLVKSTIWYFASLWTNDRTKVLDRAKMHLILAQKCLHF